MKQNRIFQVEPAIDESDIESVVNYLNSGGWLTEHKVTQELERNIKGFIGRKYSHAVPNGTIAIYLALLASDIGKGKKVGVPNLTMIATINAIIWAGAEPVLIDVDENLCLSYEQLKEVADIDALIFVPLNGRTGDGEKIEELCVEKNILLIEDSAHALGSNYKTKKCGSLGDLSILSFTPHKIITMGQGGMILTDNNEFNNNIFNLKTFNRSKDKQDWHDGFGLNFKITDIQSSLGLSQFNKLNMFVENKRKNLEIYRENIDNKEISFIDFQKDEVPWFFDIVCSSKKYKDEIKEHLSENNIETRDCYPALSFQNYLKEVEKTDLSYSEKISENILWLPSSNTLTKEEVETISNLISNHA